MNVSVMEFSAVLSLIISQDARPDYGEAEEAPRRTRIPFPSLSPPLPSRLKLGSMRGPKKFTGILSLSGIYSANQLYHGQLRGAKFHFRGSSFSQPPHKPSLQLCRCTAPYTGNKRNKRTQEKETRKNER